MADNRPFIGKLESRAKAAGGDAALKAAVKFVLEGNILPNGWIVTQGEAFDRLSNQGGNDSDILGKVIQLSSYSEDEISFVTKHDGMMHGSTPYVEIRLSASALRNWQNTIRDRYSDIVMELQQKQGAGRS